jgi:hypothetical protein
MRRGEYVVRRPAGKGDCRPQQVPFVVVRDAVVGDDGPSRAKRCNSAMRR